MAASVLAATLTPEVSLSRQRADPRLKAQDPYGPSCPRMSRGRMKGKTCRLIQGQKIIILTQDAEGDGFCAC